MDLNLDVSPPVYLNLNVRGMKPSATVAINERSLQLQANGKTIYRLGLGQSPFPVPERLVRALQDNAHQKEYLPVKGLPALQVAIANFYRRNQQLDYSPNHVLIGPGTKELMFLMQLAYYGDLVIPSPSWVSYAPQAQVIGRHLHWLPTTIESGLGVTPEALETLCAKDPSRPRLLILNYPGNPTGMTYTIAQLKAIAEVARRYRVLILADEIYCGLTFSGEHTSIARYYPEGTIISNGLSKWCGAGGWRLGAFVFPSSLDWLLDAMAAIASETFTSTSAPIQYAAVEAFRAHKAIEEYQLNSRLILEALCHWVWHQLTAIGVQVTMPKGGFYLFPNFNLLRKRLAIKGATDGPSFCERLLEDTGVACLPGCSFGRPQEELSARIACVDFDGGEALTALKAGAPLDEKFLRRYCTPVVTAIELLCEWVS